MGSVAGVILAAGLSSRLGAPKQLLDLDGRPVLAHTIAAARAAALDPLLLVLGHAAEEIPRRVDTHGLTIVVNPAFREGQSTSVRAAVRALPEDVDAAVFLLGDQPLVSPAVIERLVAAYRRTGASIVQPRYRQGRGNPVLLSRALFAEVEGLTGDTGARPLLRRHAGRIEQVDASDFDRPDDIDSWEDLERVRARFTSPREATGQ